jgi:prepilin-type N-terminal cleavage/methylation domain-containing protein
VVLRFKQDSGFSAIELLVVVAIIGSMAAIGLPLSSGMIDDIKIRADAQALSAAIAQTKLTSSAKFTHARLFVNTATNKYRIQTWNKTGTPGWLSAGDEVLLSDRSRFGFGTVTAPPPNTLATLAQAPACLDDVGAAITGTACLIFSSRGVSITAAGVPATTQAIYLTGPSGTFAIILGAAGQLQVWRTTQTGASSWRQQ